jgi:hypothetical protein
MADDAAPLACRAIPGCKKLYSILPDEIEIIHVNLHVKKNYNFFLPGIAEKCKDEGIGNNE